MKKFTYYTITINLCFAMYATVRKKLYKSFFRFHVWMIDDAIDQIPISKRCKFDYYTKYKQIPLLISEQKLQCQKIKQEIEDSRFLSLINKRKFIKAKEQILEGNFIEILKIIQSREFEDWQAPGAQLPKEIDKLNFPN